VSKDFVIFEPRNAKPLYNKHIAVEAFSMLRKTHPNSILLLASGNSDPAYLGQLKSQVQRLRLQDSVRFLEKLSPIEMAELYNIADLTVSVPRTDGFPQSIYEALACGSRLLLSDLPQYNDFVSAFQAVPVVEIGDASATAQAFKSTLQVGVDEEYRAKAHAYAEANANADSESAKLLAIYAELASRPR
jgi:glycosyltransferase involved in cell wall biosynthesis